MPVFSDAQKAMFRSILSSRVHTTSVRVQKIVSSSDSQPNPHYEARNVDTYATYSGFMCSVFDILSGKTDRMFGVQGVQELTKELGLMDSEIRVVQYVCDLTLTDDVLADITNNLEVNEKLEIDGEWWLVRNVVEDSEGTQHTALLTK